MFQGQSVRQSPFSFGNGSVYFCEIIGTMVNLAIRFGLETPCLPVLWAPGLHTEAQEHFAIAKKCTS